MKRTIPFCLYLLISIPCLSQQDNIRLIENRLPAITDSVQYVDALNRLAMLLYEQNADSTAFYANKASEIANRIDYAQGKADATNNKGVTADVKGDVQTALRFYNDAYNQYNALRDSSNIVQTLMNMAMVHAGEGKNEKAKENFRQAFNLSAHLSHDSIVSILIYNNLLQYPEQFTKENTDRLIEKAVEIATRYHDTRLLLAIDQLKANRLISTGQRDSGIALLQHSLTEGKARGLFFMTVDMMIELGDLFATSDSAKAVDYYKQALTVTDEKKFQSYEAAVAQKLFDFYAARRDTSKAYLYSQKLLDAYAEQEENNRREGFDYIDFALKDQQLTLAQQRSNYNARLLWLACMACLMAIAIIVLLWLSSRRNQQTHQLLQKQYAELEAISASLEKRNSQYARLLKAVAHDLRNPIGAVVSASQIMLETPDSNMLKLVHQAGSQCLRLIGELLETDFEFRPESLHKESVDLGELLQSVAGLLKFKAADKEQSLLICPIPPTTLYIDREQMRRVIDNLIVNAIKFSPSGSTITIAAKEQGDHLLLSVKDEGIGIPPRLAHQLFDPFTLAKRKGTAGEPTFGLGLSICKQIVEAHAGSIWFESAENAGTTFFVRLPVSN
ncbi:MAG: hypothetical protein JST68_10345 [Bacteroidetes bacterium]|nr:hypothetical protein [Bacteroidota bacterium]